jgi:hypothetical protein
MVIAEAIYFQKILFEHKIDNVLPLFFVLNYSQLSGIKYKKRE